MFTYKFYVKRGNAVMLRIVNNRRKAEVATGMRMDESTLSNALSQHPANVNYQYHVLFSRWVSGLENIKVQLACSGRSNEDVREIRKLVAVELLGKEEGRVAAAAVEPEPEAKVGSLVPFLVEHANRYARRSTRESNEYTLSVIRKFCAEKEVVPEELDFEDVNYAWLSDFDGFMCKCGLSQNTRRIHLANLRAAINDAFKRELTDADPFRRFRLKSEKTQKRSLPVEDLRRLFDYPTEEHAVFYRDMFKLIFMLIGINTVDLYGLKEVSAQGRVEYRRAKTGRLYSVKVEPEALAIIERYRGVSALLNIADRYKDHRYFRRDTNDALRLIGEVSRKGRGGKKEYKPLWPEVSTYWARHSWATVAADLDVPDAVISLALGHAGPNAVTDIYIRRNRAKVDRANRMVLDWVLYKKRSSWTE